MLDITKTATDQAFGGRRIKVTMFVLVAEHDHLGQLVPRPAQCIEIDGDDPVFKSSYSDSIVRGLEFVASESLLTLGKWCFPDRV